MARLRAACARVHALRRREQLHRQHGFTLVEIMVVVMIIGLLVGTVGVVAFNRFKKAQIKNAQTVVKNVEGAVEMYMMDNNGDCPKDLEELRAEKIIKKDPKDPWGQLLLFKCPGEQNTDGVDISSKGPDKEEGTDDDITNWEE
jgi:general secretion pathway protein G